MNKNLLGLAMIAILGISAMEDNRSPRDQWLAELSTLKEKCMNETVTRQEVEAFFKKEVCDLQKLMADAYEITHCRGFYPFDIEEDNESAFASLCFGKAAFELAQENQFNLNLVKTMYSDYSRTNLEEITKYYNKYYSKYNPSVCTIL